MMEGWKLPLLLLRTSLLALLRALLLASLASSLVSILGLASLRAAEPELEAQLAQLLRSGFDRPQQALLALQKLPAAQSPSAATQLRLRLTEGRLQVMAADIDAAQRSAEKLAADPNAAQLLLLLRAEIADRLGQSELAADFASQTLEALAQDCPRDGLTQAVQQQGCDYRAAWSALRVLGRTQYKEGALPLAQASAQYALALAQAGRDASLLAQSLGQLALLAQAQGLSEQADAYLAQAIKAAQGDVLNQAFAKNYQGAVAGLRADSVAQLRALEEGLALAKLADAPRLAAHLQGNIADAYLRLAQPAQALKAARQALPVVLGFKDLRIERSVRQNIAIALIQLGLFDQARHELARTNELRGESADQGLRAEELRELGEAWAQAGQAKEAITLFHAERKLSAELTARNREVSLQQLKIKYDSDRKQADLDLLQRERNLVDQQLSNRGLAQQAGVAVAVLLGLTLIFVVLMVRKVRAARQHLQANELLLRAQSERDPLTDLANRRHLLGVMALQPKAEFTGALLMIDIDHFKHINDQHGHGVGDQVICEVARRISHAVRAEDLVVRWGGEEFLVFAPDVDQAALHRLAKRILMEVGALPVQAQDGPLRVTVSIGFAHFPLPPAMLDLHWEQAVNWADMALYTAKSRGRNQAMGIATVDAGDAEALMQIEADFDAACSSDRVSLHQVLGPAAL
ncbi:GGDEF domain-containing protein [Paucibacter sp. B2R-40]|uniref:GGDEF domain-containing protein n=1 Tax=Paucibacter sp. B2R-40 TaxID=2893554 RepID=UPI0021E4491C|nr:GGDEF domain-containing protein [Paucibacter sp. B2R-40]MCV2356408.1 GGDEF domain-containing protein [Paucibacter sp. B2R-40]